MKFNDLSIQEKAAVIKLGVGGGLRSLQEIRQFWDGMGNPDDPPVIQKVNKSQADFVQRLKDPNREYIQDWEIPGNIATHKMSWADDGVVYPQVQNVNGRLVDFSRPPYDTWAGYDNAVRNGDTIHMTPEEAEWFTTHYKDYYPGFNEYKKGGSIHIKPENRGKFTALKKRTGHSASWFKEHGTPAQKKMATFALNSRHWNHKHSDGGPINPTQQQIDQARMRYKGYFDAMVNNGINPIYASNAAYYATQQSFAEMGWQQNKYNNYGGMKNSKGLISYPSEEAYFNAWVKNANNKWPEYFKSQSIEDWDEALNHTSLGLFNEKLFNVYQKENPNTYIYAPVWENESYLNKMQGVKNRMDVSLGNYHNDYFMDYMLRQDPLNYNKNEYIGNNLMDKYNKKYKGGHLFDAGGPDDPPTIFDRWRQYMQDNTIDVPITFRLPEVQVTAQAPKPGSPNYDRYIANTYDAWKRGDIDINTLPTETRNRVRGYSGTIAAQRGMDTATKVAGMTVAVPAAIIGGINGVIYGAPYLMKGMDYLSNPLTTISKGLKLGSTPQIIAQTGDKLIDIFGTEIGILDGVENLKKGNTRKGLTEIGLSTLPAISNVRQFTKSRKMIQQIQHNIFDDAINKATKVYDEDYLNAYKIPQRRSFLTTPYDKNPEVMFGGFEGIPAAEGFADQYSGFFKIKQPNVESFLYSGINNSQKVLNNFVKKHYTPTVYHEVRHLYQPHTTSFFDKDVPLSLWNPSRGKYYTANTQHPLYKSSLYKFDKNINKGLINSGWTSSPAEFDAEMGLFRLKNNLGDTRFYDWNIEDQNRAIKTLSKRFHFNKNDTKQILNDMSSFGYFENGGPIKPFSYLPIPEVRY